VTGKAVFFACSSFFLIAPAELHAAGDPAAPATASFAYHRSHPVTALPDAVIDSVAHSEAGADSVAEEPVEPAAAIGIAPARRMTRDSVCTAIASAARANELPVSFFANLIWQESNFRSSTVSPAGAQGIAQFMPQTAREFGLVNPFEPIEALFTAGKFLRQLAGRFGNLGLAAAAYNAGPKRVADWLGKRARLPGETRDYVKKITGRPADVWTSNAFARAPEAAVMPARAPCYAVAEEVEAQARAAQAAWQEVDLKVASAGPAQHTAQGKDQARDKVMAWRLAVAKASWRLRTMLAARNLREAAKLHTLKTASAATARIAGRAVKKPPVRMASAVVDKEHKPAAGEKGRKPASAKAAAPARRTHYASAR
jgi:hypothetical protein